MWWSRRDSNPHIQGKRIYSPPQFTVSAAAPIKQQDSFFAFFNYKLNAFLFAATILKLAGQVGIEPTTS